VKPRSAALDILRFAAVLMVLGRHMEPYPLELGKNVVFYATRFWQNGGWTGVDLFFVLSGYLIGGLLFDEEKRRETIRIRRFLFRRALKIWPAFYVLIVATLVVRRAAGIPLNGRAVTGELLFLQNYVGGLWPHTWSLAVEEHFYLGLPLVLAILLWRRPCRSDPFRIIPVLTVAVAATCLVLRVSLALTLPLRLQDMVHLIPTHLRIDSLLIGVTLAYLHHYRTASLTRFRESARHVLLPAGILGFVPAFYRPPDAHWALVSIMPLVLALASAAILLAATRVEDMRPNALGRFAAFLGARSYSVYLWHMAVAGVALRFWQTRGAAGGSAWWFL